MNWIRTTWMGALAGLVSAGVALAAGDLVAAFTGPAGTPVAAVGSAAIDLTPTGLKDWAIAHFGTHDKPVLLSGIYATMLVLAVLAGLLARRARWAGLVVFALFAGVGAWAASARQASLLPAVTAGLVGCTVLAVLTRRAHRPPAPALASDRTPHAQGDAAEAMSRRGFLLTAAAVTVAAALVQTGAQALTAARYNVAKARAALRLPAPARPLRPVPASAHPDVPGLSAFTTPNAAFYRVDTDLTVPQVPPSSWRLRIHGMVDHPVELTFEDLIRRPLAELDYTLSCVSNQVGGPYVSTARWLGASLPDLLREAGLRSGAQQLVGRSQDRMTIGTPLDLLMDGRHAMLAVGMNGEPLPVEHGFPCRSLCPGLFGYASATKWLVELEATTFAAYDPYWVRRGWDRTGLVRTASRIEVPAPLSRVSAGAVTVAGTAWATHRGIAAVEVRVDSGPWQQARLATDAGPDLWRQWTWTWNATSPGVHALEVRATDATGQLQPETRTPPFPSGSTGWHNVVVTVT